MKFCLILALLAIGAHCRDEVKSAKYSMIKDKLEQVHAIERGLEDDIIAQLESFQQWMLEGNPEMGIPVLDPFQVDHYEYGTSNDNVAINVAFDGASVTGLATFTILDLDINLLLLRVGGTLNIQELHLYADHYYLDGLIGGLLPLFGDGYADIYVRNVNLTGGASLSTLNDQVSLKDVEVGMAFDSISGVIENILGSDMDDVINDILNILGADIFNSISAMVTEDVSLALQETVNESLIGLSLQDLLDMLSGDGEFHHVSMEGESQPAEVKQGNADDYLDAILENVRVYLIDHGYDNYTLPDQLEGFSEDWAGITWHGEATLTDGFLEGLQTIHRVGGADLAVNGDDGSITLTGNIEFFDFAAGYHMHVGFMGINIDANAEVTITSVQVALKAKLTVEDPATRNFVVEVEELNITNPGLVTVHFSGLGPLDFLLDGLGFIVGNVFGGLIFDAIEGPIKEGITQALGEVIPFNYL